MHSCTKGTYTAGSHHTANYRSKGHHAESQGSFRPLSHDPHPHKSQQSSKPDATASPCPESIVQHTTRRKKEEGEGRGGGDFLSVCPLFFPRR